MFEALFKYPYDVFVQATPARLSRVPVEALVLALVAVVVLAWYLYRRPSPQGRSRPNWLLVALRAAALGILLIVLAVPALEIARPSRAVFTAVLVDCSRSMSIPDAKGPGGAKGRLDAAIDALAGEAGLVGQMGRVSNVLVYAFDQEARRAADVRTLKAEGQSTNLFAAVRDMEAELRGLPLAAVVLVTDGCRNEGGGADDVAGLLKARRVPLYTVGLGNPNPPRDYEIRSVFPPKWVRRNTEVEVFVTVRHTDLPGPFDIAVTREGTALASQRVVPKKDAGDVERVRVRFTPDVEGAASYTVSIPPAPNEAVTDNNARTFPLEIKDDRLPVLYVEGSPRMEYRFLRRALYRDRDFRLVGLLRLAKDRFLVQGLNQGEQYLENGFPNPGGGALGQEAEKRLFGFEAIILGDIEAGYFSPEQLALIEKFVRVRGGGLLMLGGVNSFGLGKYAATPVGRMLPVPVSADDPAYSDEQYRVRVTDAGLTHPLMRLVPDAEDNRLLWEKAPPFIGVTPIRRAKPGAMVLLEHETTGLPVLAVQEYGQGRVAGFTSGGSWYGQVSRPANDEFHEKFWKQVVRWLVAGAKERLDVEVDPDVCERGRPVVITAVVREKDLQPVNDAVVAATVTNPIGNAETVPMDWILSEDGVYQCRFVPTDEGRYRVAVQVQGWDLEPRTCLFEVSEPVVEFSNAGLKEDVLRRMAQATGGRYVGVTETASLPADIARHVQAASQAGIQPERRQVWDMPSVFLVLLGIMAVEWFIRRRRGLA
ncbi:MAG TPA: glutamine amidotransferase [Phycisphaerae bacterium]|nr:glutamine amidotransferase [Phycisphaerae bacterium]